MGTALTVWPFYYFEKQPHPESSRGGKKEIRNKGNRDESPRPSPVGRCGALYQPSSKQKAQDFLPWWSSVQETTFQCKGRGFHPWSGELRSHMPWANKPQAPRLLSPHAAPGEARAPQSEHPFQERPAGRRELGPEQFENSRKSTELWGGLGALGMAMEPGHQPQDNHSVSLCHTRPLSPGPAPGTLSIYFNQVLSEAHSHEISHGPYE